MAQPHHRRVPWPGATSQSRSADGRVDQIRRQNGVRCEAAFFLGHFRLQHKQLDEAHDWLEKATLWCPPSFIEFVAARTELQALELSGVNGPDDEPDAIQRYRTVADVNVRSGPGTEYRRVTLLTKGTLVDIAGGEYGWYRVSGIADAPTYVHSDYVTTDTSPAGPKSSSPKEPPMPTASDAALTQPAAALTQPAAALTQSGEPPSKVYRATSRANYRDGPDLSYQLLGQLAIGETISVVGVNGEWLRFKLGSNGFAYVHAKLMDDGSATEAAEEQLVPTRYRTTDQVNYRNGPGINYRRLGQLFNGATITVIGKTREWLVFRLTAGSWTFVHQDFLILEP